MHALIFTESGKNFGLGHLMRCLALSDYLINCNFSVDIYNRGDYKSPLCINLDWLSIENISPLIESFAKPPLVIVDSYYVNLELANFIASKSKVCVFLDDFNRMIYPKEGIIFNGALNAKRLYIDVKNEMYVGIEYGLLRSSFRKRENKIINKEIQKILVILGGSDANNNIQKILDILEKEIVYELIDVVVGIDHCPISYGFNTSIHSSLSPSVLKNLMLSCDIAISGGGSTMVELQSTLTPTIALQIAQNQAYQLRAWRDVGLRVIDNVHQIKYALKTLRKFKDRKKLHSNLSKINIGTKVDSFIQELVKKYHS